MEGAGAQDEALVVAGRDTGSTGTGGRLDESPSNAREVVRAPGSGPRRRPRQWLDRAIEFIAASSMGTLLRLWLLMVLLCGGAYWAAPAFGIDALVSAGAPVRFDPAGLGTSIYFSFITATSVGYGDVLPLGGARLLAIAESAGGLLLFGCLVSKLVSRRQEEMTEEIHRIAFEDRLGRVRTNLHLVLSELRAMSADCDGEQLPAQGLLPRIESAAMVFSGELRAIHDLLFRPQQAPEEQALEAILANLSAGMAEFSALVERLNRVGEGSQGLRSSLASISRLAGEICGECVPREYAPELKIWMDRVQELAREISRA